MLSLALKKIKQEKHADKIMVERYYVLFKSTQISEFPFDWMEYTYINTCSSCNSSLVSEI